LSDVDVDIYDASTDYWLGDVLTDASGVYWIRGLAAGGYKLRFRDTNEVYITEYYDDKPALTSADPIAVTAGVTSTANAQLALGGVISGVVTAEGNGAPLVNIDVNVYDASSATMRQTPRALIGSAGCPQAITSCTSVTITTSTWQSTTTTSPTGTARTRSRSRPA
jgi:hypothetical protein